MAAAITLFTIAIVAAVVIMVLECKCINEGFGIGTSDNKDYWEAPLGISANLDIF